MFNAPYLDRKDLREMPLVERRGRLSTVLGRVKVDIRCNEPCVQLNALSVALGFGAVEARNGGVAGF